MKTPALVIAALILALPLGAQERQSGSSVPLSPAWNIAASGKAASSGELLFRVTPANGTDPVEVTVFVLSGANDTGVASSIRRALNSQLDASRFNVQSGEGANVLLTDARDRGFTVELMDSDVENIRVMVQSAAPTASPTVPEQGIPADQPRPVTPDSPGDTVPPPAAAPPGSSAAPVRSTPPANASAPPSGSSAPPVSPPTPPADTSAPLAPANGAGAAASAPPPGGMR